MNRVQFNLTGFHGVWKDEPAPVLRVNFADAEAACVFHSLQMATDSEVRKAEAGEMEDGVVHDLISGAGVVRKAGGFSSVRPMLSRAVLFSAAVPVIMSRYDSEDVVFTGVFDNEDDGVEALVAAASLEKASFDFDVATSEGVVLFLRALAKAGDATGWRAAVSNGPRVRLVKSDATQAELGPLPAAVLNVVPEMRESEPVVKADFSPFKTLGDFVGALEEAVREMVVAGVFGLSQYRVEGGDLEELPPRWWYICEIGNGWLVVNVDFGEAEIREGAFRVGFSVSDSGVVEMSGKFEPVRREAVWVREDEVATVCPVAEGEPAGTVQDTEANPPASDAGDSASVESSEKKPYGVPTKKFQVVKTDLREAAEAAGEERYVLGVVLEPNDGIDAALNPDTQGDVYSAADIKKAAHKWMSEFLNVGLMHAELAGRRIVPVESYIVPVDMEIEGQKIGKGAWMLGAIVEDPALWEAVKAGQLTGWSMGGFAVREPL